MCPSHGINLDVLSEIRIPATYICTDIQHHLQKLQLITLAVGPADSSVNAQSNKWTPQNGRTAESPPSSTSLKQISTACHRGNILSQHPMLGATKTIMTTMLEPLTSMTERPTYAKAYCAERFPILSTTPPAIANYIDGQPVFLQWWGARAGAHTSRQLARAACRRGARWTLSLLSRLLSSDLVTEKRHSLFHASHSTGEVWRAIAAPVAARGPKICSPLMHSMFVISPIGW